MKPVLAVAGVAVMALFGLLMLNSNAVPVGVKDAGLGAGAAATQAVGAAGGAVKAVTQAITDAAAAATGGPVAPVATQSASDSWVAAELTQDQIKARIAGADISEADRVVLMGAFQQADGDPAALQSVLDKLKIALTSAKKK